MPSDYCASVRVCLVITVLSEGVPTEYCASVRVCLLLLVLRTVLQISPRSLASATCRSNKGASCGVGRPRAFSWRENGETEDGGERGSGG